MGGLYIAGFFSLTGVLAVLREHLADLVSDFALWNLDIILERTVVGHEGEETVISDIDLYAISMFGQFLWLCQVLQAGTRGERRWAHPCCGWMETDLPTSCW